MTPVFRAYQNSTSTPRYARNRAINNRVAPGDVRFGSKADSCSAATHVRFTPDSDPESGLPRKVMSALPPKADMCGATRDVRFGPKAGIQLAGTRKELSGIHTCLQPNYSGARALRNGMLEICITPVNG
jgi:hypothetical protein